ncbi:phosphotransferase [Spongiibacter nanhainus]|uniref:Phosphotransferase n=1 Tax=Spongiibacter nanhainus TaxID=2794344 RepID=A0A7T4QYU1_9GAMM|nr:phosphotransferase [Spongiibacter nanhainus]QQD17308.1 phosphotransferase [Spongiibacter nanhainus]
MLGKKNIVVDSAQMLGRAAVSVLPWVPAPGPMRAADIKKAWLQSRIADGVAGAELKAISPLGGDFGTTDRQRLGLEWNEAGTAAGLPQVVFIKSTPKTASSRLMVGPLKMASNEVAFYRTARQFLGDEAPRIYASNSGPGARFLLVLEDLSARGCQTFTLADEAPLSHLQGMMVALAKLHSAFWQSPKLDRELAWLDSERSRPGFRMMMAVHRRFRQRFINGREEVPDPVRELARVLTTHEDAVISVREAGPHTLVHGDTHLGNTYILDDGRSGLLDWQIAHRGQGIREVAYFLGTGAPVALRRKHESDLLKLYIKTLSENGVVLAKSFDEVFDQYRFWLAYSWDAVQLTRNWQGLQSQESMDRSWERINTAVEDLDVAGAVLSSVADEK